MFIFAWSILCWTSKRPIGRSSYFCYEYNSCNFNEPERNKQNIRTLRYVADAQTVLSAVSLLTIPLTSAVCAAAAVPWLQSGGRGRSLQQLIDYPDKGSWSQNAESNGRGLSLRQLTTMADKGWTSRKYP